MTLYLLPNLLADSDDLSLHLPRSVELAVGEIQALIAEDEKEARRFLRRFTFPEGKSFRDTPIHLLNEHTAEPALKELLDMISQGGIFGLISDCGMPCLADPGAELVLQAKQRGMRVRAFSGPSSMVLALVLSGLGGQRFAFHGYLPREENELLIMIKKLENRSRSESHAAQLFIETPYRNLRLLQRLIETLDERTWLCTATDLTLPSESVLTRRVSEWKRGGFPPPDAPLDDRPTVFVIRA